MRILKLSILVIALSVFLQACGETKPENTAANGNSAVNSGNATPTATADELASARELYTKNCAECHRDSGTGGKIEKDGKTINPDDLTKDKIKKFPDEKIIKFIVDGIPDEGMPAMKGKLSDAEMKEIVRYVRVGIQKIAPKPAS